MNEVNEVNINVEPVLSPKNSNKQWVSCCFSINPVATKYFVQIIILSLLIVFSATMLVVDKGCESQRNYGALLMICLGVFLPQPKMN